MHILVMHATTNTTKPDATGAFIPEAINFRKYRESLGDTVEVIGFDNKLPPPKRAPAFLKQLEGAKPFDAIVYIGHGLRNSLPSAGITSTYRTKFTQLIQSKSLSKTKVFVTLFACSAAETTTGQPGGEGGFADKLRDDLVALGFSEGWIDAHPVPGHATQNSQVRRFFISAEQAPKGGTWLVTPGSPEFPKWRSKLNSKWRDDPFRFQFPYMSQADVLAACK